MALEPVEAVDMPWAATWAKQRTDDLGIGCRDMVGGYGSAVQFIVR
jgi:hypothetical protein